MNKTIAITSLLLIAGNTQAHDHPAVDTLTHAFEHITMTAQSWFPYLLGLSLAALCSLLFQIRRSEDSRRSR